jgi:hypothetical protein
MATKEDLSGWLIEALRANNGSASIVEVCKYVWNNYENELRRSDDLLLHNCITYNFRKLAYYNHAILAEYQDRSASFSSPSYLTE